ncbi:MAG: hypothetical protein A2021_09700 [Elusimicrobia bacterium GWF2_52_66]|nr:MAG: hypothetical protein A2021_09700 [Elusimicrobia bacterium GWF2_52_66]
MLCREDREIYKILNLLELDYDLFWKMRPRLNVVFHGVRVVTNEMGFREKEIPLVKKSGALRILCLGASPTFGWGVEETDRYSNVLQKMLLESSFPGENFEVINAGIIGYSSYQGSVLLKKIMPILKPDIVTVPFVVNDVDKYRLFLNDGKADRKAVSPSRVRLFIENSLARSGLATVLKRIIFGWNTDRAELKIKSRLPFTDTLRVSADDYYNNLLAIVQTARQQGAKTILMKMPVYNPFPDHAAGSEADRLEAEKMFTAGLRQAESGDSAAELGAITEALKYAPYSAKMYNMLGRLYYRLDNKKESRFYFDKEKKMELRACIKNIRGYGTMMKKVSTQTGVPIADVSARFTAIPRKNVASLFVEPERDIVHLSPLGHRIAAEELYRVISRNSFLEGPGKRRHRP